MHKQHLNNIELTLQQRVDRRIIIPSNSQGFRISSITSRHLSDGSRRKYTLTTSSGKLERVMKRGSDSGDVDYYSEKIQPTNCKSTRNCFANIATLRRKSSPFLNAMKYSQNLHFITTGRGYCRGYKYKIFIGYPSATSITPELQFRTISMAPTKNL